MRNKEDLAAKAVEMNGHGYNCCQAVTYALKDEVNVDEKILRDISSGFRLGMGNMEGACGALIGVIMIIGLKSEGIEASLCSKKVVERFKELCGAYICKDLKTMIDGKPLCRCSDCIKNAIYAYFDVLVGPIC